MLERISTTSAGVEKTEHNELEKLFKKIYDTPDNASIQTPVTKQLKKEIKALEQISTIIQTIGMGDIIKLYEKTKRGLD